MKSVVLHGECLAENLMSCSHMLRRVAFSFTIKLDFLMQFIRSAAPGFEDRGPKQDHPLKDHALKVDPNSITAHSQSRH